MEKVQSYGEKAAPSPLPLQAPLGWAGGFARSAGWRHGLAAPCMLHGRPQFMTSTNWNRCLGVAQQRYKRNPTRHAGKGPAAYRQVGLCNVRTAKRRGGGPASDQGVCLLCTNAAGRDTREFSFFASQGAGEPSAAWRLGTVAGSSPPAAAWEFICPMETGSLGNFISIGQVSVRGCRPVGRGRVY